MTLVNLGSINADHVYRLPHLPRPGETLAAAGHAVGLGGKGANQSVAAARAGATVRHLGAVGTDGVWARDRLAAFGVDVSAVAVRDDVATGHAIVQVDEGGENAIVIWPGANRALDPAVLGPALAGLGPGDSLLLQNETNLQVRACLAARAAGLRVIASAAPFEVAAVQAILPHVSILLLNAVEAAQLQAALGTPPEDLGLEAVVITRGAEGAEWIGRDVRLTVPAPRVQAVDTTGAGDCFAGWLAAGLDAGQPPGQAMRAAVTAAALQVTRPGASEAMPDAAEVAARLSGA